MATQLIDVSPYWKRGRLDSAQAFTRKSDVVHYVRRLASKLGKKDARTIQRVCDAVLNGNFKRIGKKVSVADCKGTIVSIDPDGRYLVVTEETSVRRDKVHVRYGFLYKDGQKTAKPVDITHYWRKDNEVRRSLSFVTEKDAIAWVRRFVEDARAATASGEKDQVLFEIAKTCRAIERQYTCLVGQTITTNNTSKNAERGPRKVSGRIVAILPEGKGLALHATNGSDRWGFIVGRVRMAQLVSEQK